MVEAVGDSERNIQIGGATAMQISDFPDDVAYIALGHLHRPHAISGAAHPVQYAGSAAAAAIQRS